MYSICVSQVVSICWVCRQCDEDVNIRFPFIQPQLADSDTKKTSQEFLSFAKALIIYVVGGEVVFT